MNPLIDKSSIYWNTFQLFWPLINVFLLMCQFLFSLWERGDIVFQHRKVSLLCNWEYSILESIKSSSHLEQAYLIWHLKQTLQILLLKCISANIVNNILAADPWFCHIVCMCCLLCFEISHSNKSINSNYQVIAVIGLVSSGLLFSSPRSPDVDYMTSHIPW